MFQLALAVVAVLAGPIMTTRALAAVPVPLDKGYTTTVRLDVQPQDEFGIKTDLK